jgi:hypothetical protein
VTETLSAGSLRVVQCVHPSFGASAVLTMSQDNGLTGARNTGRRLIGSGRSDDAERPGLRPSTSRFQLCALHGRQVLRRGRPSTLTRVADRRHVRVKVTTYRSRDACSLSATWTSTRIVPETRIGDDFVLRFGSSRWWSPLVIGEWITFAVCPTPRRRTYKDGVERATTGPRGSERPELRVLRAPAGR